MASDIFAVARCWPIAVRVIFGLGLALSIWAQPAQVAQAEAQVKPRPNDLATSYHTHFAAEFFTDKATARVTITVSQDEPVIKFFDFNAPADKYTLIQGDGEVRVGDGRMIWSPPATGGSLTYTVNIDHRRDDAFDAMHSAGWVLMRLGDLFPAARVRARKGARSVSSLVLKGPQDWGFESRYGSLVTSKTLPSTDRVFTRPTGWLVGGNIGTRREIINGRRVAVSAPVNSGVRRLDTLAFLRWTLPALSRVFPDLPQRILVAGAPRQMWRGGLSAPGSLYLHADRPLISENGTSTLLHELVHLAGMHSSTEGADWIVEGVAEYYSLLILKRSGGLSVKRFDATIDKLRVWVIKDKGVLADPSKGVDTAAAVLTLHALAAELQDEGSHIDQLIWNLLSVETVSTASLVDGAAMLLGHPSVVLNQQLTCQK